MARRRSAAPRDVNASVSVTGFGPLQEKLSRLSRDVAAQVLADGVVAGANILRSSMQARALPFRRTGFLNSHFAVEFSIAGSVATAKVGPTREAFYGGIINRGARPHAVK